MTDYSKMTDEELVAFKEEHYGTFSAYEFAQLEEEFRRRARAHAEHADELAKLFKARQRAHRPWMRPRKVVGGVRP